MSLEPGVPDFSAITHAATQVFINLRAVSRMAERISTYRGPILVALGKGPAYITTKSKKNVPVLGEKPIINKPPKPAVLPSTTSGNGKPEESRVKELKHELEQAKLQNSMLQHKLKTSQKKMQLIHLTRTRPQRKKNYPAGRPRPTTDSTTPAAREPTIPVPTAEEEEEEDEDEDSGLILLKLEKETTAKKALEKEVQDVNGTLKATTAEVGRLKMQLQKNEEEQAAVLEREKYSNESVLAVKAQNEVLSRSKSELEEEVHSLRNQLEEIERKIASLEKQKQAAEEDARLWKTKAQERRTESSNEEKSRAEFEKQLQALKKKLEGEKEAIEISKKKEKEVFEKDRLSLRAQAEELTKELDAERSKNRQLEVKVEGMEKRIIIAQHTIAALEESKASGEGAAAGLRRDLVLQIEKKASLSSQVDKLIDELADTSRALLVCCLSAFCFLFSLT